MKKIPTFVLKTSFLVIFFCFTLLNVGWSQPEMTLWYIPDSKFQRSHQHGHAQEVLIPCGWNYYHRYDGKSKIVEYGIKNEGNAPLSLNLPLTFDANSSIEFEIIEQPTKAILQPNESAHFKVKYLNLGTIDEAKGVLPIHSNDANHLSCVINFRIGGGPRAIPEEINCFAAFTRATDFGNNGIVNETQIITRTLDDNNNILEETDILKNALGLEAASLTTTNTYNNQNQILTNKMVYSGNYKSFICDEMITNTYNANGNLIKEVRITGTTAGIYEVIYDNTLDANNRIIQGTITYKNPFAMGVAMFNYTYDANGNVLTYLENDPGNFMYSLTNTYDANNNLLTSIEVVNGNTIYSIVNTYDANNNLLTSIEIESGGPTITTTNTYDGNNKLLTSQMITIPPPPSPINISETTTNTYNGFGKLEKQVILFELTFPGSTLKSELTQLYTYDNNYRLTAINSEAIDNDTPPPSFKQNITITTCGLPPISIADPCNCGDPLNKLKEGNITHFHDVLSVNGTPGDMVILQTGNTNFLDDNLVQIPNNTMLGTIPASGTLEYDFFHASGASGAITLNIGGVLSNPFEISVCNGSDCIIPTMGQWGLLIFGLLLLNLGLFFINQLENIFR